MNGVNKTYRDYKSDLIVISTTVKFAKLVGMEKRYFR